MKGKQIDNCVNAQADCNQCVALVRMSPVNRHVVLYGNRYRVLYNDGSLNPIRDECGACSEFQRANSDRLASGIETLTSGH